MSSRTGYTRRQAVHFKLSPFSFSISGFLHTGQTSISSKSLDIMRAILRRSSSTGQREAGLYEALPGFSSPGGTG